MNERRSSLLSTFSFAFNFSALFQPVWHTASASLAHLSNLRHSFRVAYEVTPSSLELVNPQRRGRVDPLGQATNQSEFDV
ncbi:hypothetical protein RSOLAG1IB_01284 [Rhizoctonia solani AG-1 IB]|uniref:Uncharacterized protein n=1 Tax=Thanatephorus cucumeris (strain AG1-IB / isolate 7/3/14) TaxID=1108050 RepID=A0A0B7FCH1_THACB|nr:hypothetical protein RSOLAG1IB_01284 [Rhizoctonia solani AG-1 IB]